MKLLVITQKVDKTDSNLGFFHEWLLRLSKKVDKLYVICLEKGNYDLPGVEVLSLGKEMRMNRLFYLYRFLYYIVVYRKKYNGVFVHMNPEYLVLGGWLWKLWHKKSVLWYVHRSVNVKLWLAEKFATNIFTTNKTSFRLKSKKVKYVGHGINVLDYRAAKNKSELKLLVVGRIAESKNLDLIVKAAKELNGKEIPVSLDIVGAPVDARGKLYKMSLNVLISEQKSGKYIKMIGEFEHKDLVEVYGSHNVFINASKTGLDKVVLEALASGLEVVGSSAGTREMAKAGVVHEFIEGDYKDLAKTLEKMWNFGIMVPNQKGVEYVRNNHNLDNLVNKIIEYYR